MKILWDEPKRLSNLSRRGLDFAQLDMEFFAASVVTQVRSGRIRSVGMFNGRPVTVIFKPLGTEALAVISMRIASRKERNVL